MLAMGRPPHLYSAAYVLLLDGCKVLLSRRMNTGFQDGLFGLPAGHLNKGESVVSAAIREVFRLPSHGASSANHAAARSPSQ